jgi:hypothetical protein
MTRRKLLTNHLNPSSLLQRSWILILLAVGSFALSPETQAVQPNTPDPGGSLPVSNTADGLNALKNITTGLHNSAFGFDALLLNTDANFNTAVGSAALLSNDGTENTAVGTGALILNGTSGTNTAVGAFALFFNATGDSNTAVGDRAMQNNTGGPFNTAVGWQALMNSTENANVAVGDLALVSLNSGEFNTAIGAAAGSNNTNGSNNIYIGQGSAGVAGESHTCYIQEIAGASIPTANAAFVFVDVTTGQLATLLVNADGNRVTVPISQSQLQAAPQGKYETVPRRSHEDGRQAMLDESRNQQKRIAELEGTVERLSAMVKEQAAQIQKVSAQLEMVKPAPKVVANKP